MPTEPQVSVTQADRLASAPIFEAYGAPNYAALALKNSPHIDGLLVVRVLAQHATTARCVAVEEGFDAAVNALDVWADGFMGGDTQMKLRLTAKDLRRNKAEILAIPPQEPSS